MIVELIDGPFEPNDAEEGGIKFIFLEYSDVFFMDFFIGLHVHQTHVV